MVGKDEVAGVFAAEGVVVFAQGLDDLSIADAGGDDVDVRLSHGGVEAEVAHHGDGDGVATEFTALLQGEGGEGDDAVAADNVAMSIGEDDAVGIAIEADAEVGLVLGDEGGGVLGMEGAAVVVDVDTIGLGGHGDDFGTEFAEDQRGDEVRSAVSAVYDNFQATEGDVIGGVFGELDVAAAGVIDTGGFADVERLDVGFGW